MGEAGLGLQTCSAVAQPGRVYGCAVVATKKIGGRSVSRLAFRSADVIQEQNLYRSGRTLACAGNRGQYDCLQLDRVAVLQFTVRSECSRPARRNLRA